MQAGRTSWAPLMAAQSTTPYRCTMISYLALAKLFWRRSCPGTIVCEYGQESGFTRPRERLNTGS